MNKLDAPIAIGAALLFGFIIPGFCIAVAMSEGTDLRKEAIQRGVARYHPITGAWEWTVPVVTEKKEEDKP